MQGLLQDIKNQDFRQIYLLCGEEAYLRDAAFADCFSVSTPAENSFAAGRRQHEFPLF